ncbi:hypothetical protein AGDE_15758 [Angomonas deanei]|uniref:Uncharacterized protein n=1 Tax=Angomonas deanei TaxID=59799 RepID=A0A7G2C264_9TRYP|nr:hypothetical protein AGDE_15758 [Angomonas deanei]CAD2213888.1 hypothetical protein, conserved [Angomonas deanei]|eukprot:EPY18529.1 hypothetical protein AGDE_15758 [Angomonas deanei]
MTPATSLAQLSSILSQSVAIVQSLWGRAGNSGTASRVAIQMQIIEYITWVFETLVPMPLPPGTAPDTVPEEERHMVASFYTTDSFSSTGDADVQQQLLSDLRYLQLSFGNAWQAVEIPTRGFDSERCLISMTMLIVFDAILRNSRGSKKATLIATLIQSEGGYYPSTSLGKSNLSFTSVAATMELNRPTLLIMRAGLLRYIDYQKENLQHELFDLRMPDKLEVSKNDNTITFIRLILDNAGYQLEECGGMPGRTEMDKLTEWLVNNRSPIARDHTAFVLLRDMVILAKFLGTMEMRDAQLLRRRKEMDPLASWYISFDEGGPGRQMSAGWRTQPMPLKWECAMVRGRDMDKADIIVQGFGQREVHYGEGLVLHSPIAVDRLVEVDRPTEDDVLHATSLPKLAGY